MPRIIDYPTLLQRLTAEGLRCNYHNGGSFSLPPGVESHIRGWIGPSDDTIRPAMRPLARQVSPPFEATLALAAAEAWQDALPGPVWMMPASHWSFELTYGSREWLPDLLTEAHIDPARLAHRTDAAALEFDVPERQLFVRLLQGVLEHLIASDFAMAFPGRQTVAAIHHHKQLWWVTASATIARRLDSILVNPPQRA